MTYPRQNQKDHEYDDLSLDRRFVLRENKNKERKMRKDTGGMADVLQGRIDNTADGICD
jgi:hypothetical protein